jgi:hypothetical protein
MRSKAFLIGLAFGVALFVAANVYSYLRVVPPCCDFFGPFGVPFEMGGYGGFAGQTYILWRGVLANASVALLVGVILGWACRRWFLSRSRLK